MEKRVFPATAHVCCYTHMDEYDMEVTVACENSKSILPAWTRGCEQANGSERCKACMEYVCDLYTQNPCRDSRELIYPPNQLEK